MLGQGQMGCARVGARQQVRRNFTGAWRGRGFGIAIQGVLAASVVGCSRERAPDRIGISGIDASASVDTELPHSSLHPTRLIGEVFLEVPALGGGSKIAFGRGVLLVGDGKGDPFLHEIDAGARRVVRSFGRLGDGPGDFKSVWDLSFRDGDVDGIWVFDLMLRRLTRVSFKQPATAQVIAPQDNGVVRLAWFGPNLLVGLTTADTGRLVLLDSKGAVVSRSSGPLLGGDSITRQVRLASSAQASLCVQPSALRFALLYTRAGRVELYGEKAQLIGRAAVPFPSDGQFQRDARTGRWSALTLRNFYKGCTASEAQLYALFSGRRGSPEYGDRATNGVFIHVFDWEGRLQRVLQLDRDVSAITVDGDSVLYGASWQSDAVFKFRIPPRE